MAYRRKSTISALRLALALGAGWAGLLGAGRLEAGEASIDPGREMTLGDAEVLIKRGQFDEAADILLSFHRNRPNDKRILFDCVAALAWAGRHREAADLALAADYARIRPPQYSLAAAALALRQAGDLEHAYELYLDGRSRYPGAADFMLGQILTLADAGNFAEAEPLLEEFPRLFGRTDGLAEAERHVAARREESEFARRREEAVRQARSGRFDAALAALASLIEENPGRPDLRNDQLAILSRAGRHEDALRLLPGLSPLDELPAYARQAVADSLRETGRHAQAAELYRKLLDAAPESVDLVESLALTLLQAGKPDEAEALIARHGDAARSERMADAVEAIVRKRREEVAALASDGRFDEALRRLRLLLEFRPDHPGAEYDRIAALSWETRHAEAAEKAMAVPDLDLAPAYARQAAAASLRETGQTERAEALYRRLLESAPDAPPLAEGLALALVQAGKIDEAEALTRRVAGDDPERMAAARAAIADHRRGEAAALAAAGRFGDAAERLEAARRFAPVRAGDEYDLLCILSWSGRHKEAARMASGVDWAAAPDHAVLAAAAAFRMAGDWAAAEPLYRRLLEKNPDSQAAAEGMALTLIQAGRPEEAETFAVRAGPSAEEALLSARREAAVRQARAGELAAAAQALEELRRRYPGRDGILHDLVTVLAWAERHEEALAAAIPLDLAAAPEHALAAVAASLRKTRRNDMARAVYARAFGMFPDSVDLAAGLAMTLADMGERQAGVAVLDAFGARRPGVEDEALVEARRYLAAAPAPEPSTPYETPRRSETPYRDEQDALVARARDAGGVEESLARMADLLSRHPGDVYLLGDYLVLLNWSKNHETAINLASGLNPALVHDYVVQSVAGSLIALGRHFAARRFLEEVIAAQHGNPELMVVAGTMLAIAGDEETGQAYLDRAEASRTPGLGGRIQEARRRIGDEQLRAMRELDRSLRERDAGGRDARVLEIMASGGAGAGRLARELSAGMAEALSPETRRNIALAAIRQKIAWGEQGANPGERDFRERQFGEALAELDVLEAEVAGDAPPEFRGSVAGARARSLYELNRLPEAIAEYELAHLGGAVFPDGDLLAVAGAYLASRRPCEAKALYLEVMARAESPEPPSQEDLFEAKNGLFWALLENEELAAALEQAERHYREGTAAGGPNHYEVDDYRRTDAAVGYGLALLHTGFAEEAERFLRRLADDAPGHAGALAALAAAQSQRGWPRKADETIDRARLHDPEDTGLAVRKAESLLARNDWPQARDAVRLLAPHAGSVIAVERLAREWERHEMWELRMDANYGYVLDAGAGAGTGSAGGGADLSLGGRLYSPPLGHYWRVFGGMSTAAGDFAEGHARQTVALGGLEFRHPMLEASVEARADRVGSTELGLSLGGVATPDDHWRFPFSFELGSRDTPLRARRAGITADSAGLGASYRWHEGASLGLSFNYMDFSDGNRRLAGSGFITRRLWSRFNHQIDARLAAYASGNGKDDDRPYFNPRRDFELGAGFSYSGLLWRRYERSLRHTLGVAAGGYRQRYFGNDLVWDVGYGQSLSLSERFAIDYGATLRRRVYDGNPEHSIAAYFSAGYRF